MEKAPKKTNAARILDELGIDYALLEAPVDVSDLSAVGMAHALRVEPHEVYKTLVVRGDRNGILLACIPAAAELDFKLLAVASGDKSTSMVPLKEVQPLTGYIRGGCSPIGTKKPYPVYLDESAILLDRLFVSAGHRGVQFHLTPDDLIRAVHATYAPLTRS
ncbi:MAG: Cys-tRNA(Pro) deacylase [Bilophila sp.]